VSTSRGDTPLCLRVLGLKPPCTEEDVHRAYRARAMRTHPDRGGDEESFIVLKAARDEALILVQVVNGSPAPSAATTSSSTQRASSPTRPSARSTHDPPHQSDAPGASRPTSAHPPPQGNAPGREDNTGRWSSQRARPTGKKPPPTPSAAAPTTEDPRWRLAIRVLTFGGLLQFLGPLGCLVLYVFWSSVALACIVGVSLLLGLGSDYLRYGRPLSQVVELTLTAQPVQRPVLRGTTTPVRFPSPSPLTQSAVAPRRQPPFADDFSNANSGWPRTSPLPARWQGGYDNGEYRVIKLANTGYTSEIAFHPDVYTDFEFEIDAWITSHVDNAYLILPIRLQPNGNGYYFLVDPNRLAFRVVRQAGTTPSVLADWQPIPSQAWRPDRNGVVVRAFGPELVLWVNGAEIRRLRDSTFSSGFVGLGVGHFQDGRAEARFDNFRITRLY
jgi:hypothetical protein